MDYDRQTIERMVAEILKEKLRQPDGRRTTAGPIIRLDVSSQKVEESDRLDTGRAADKVYTHDLFSLQESPRLGCGLMVMENTTFDWTLNYDEIDYVIEGTLTIRSQDGSVTASPGEIILIPKGSKIQFSVPGKARFLYVTYPADWSSAG